MRRIPASAVAMAAGWAAGLLGLAVVVREDLGPLAWWTALVMFAAWVLCVVPVVSFYGDCRPFASRRWGWLGWMGLALASYCVLVAAWLGRDALLFGWHPAVAGGVAGFAFSRLRAA